MCRRTMLTITLAIALQGIAPAAANAHGAALVTRATHAAKPGPTCLGPSLICPVGGLIRRAVGAGVEIGRVIGRGPAAAAGSVMSGVVNWAAQGGAWLVGLVAKQIEKSARPALDSTWFSARYARMIRLAAWISALFLILTVGEAVLARDMSRLLRSVLIALPCALLLTFVAVTLVQIGLAVTDWMTLWALSGTKHDVESAFRVLAAGLVAGAYVAPFALFLSAIAVSLLALLVWFELVLRESAVYVGVAFLPLSLAAMIWQRTAHWSRRLTEWLAAIILAKFTIATSFALAAAAIVGAPASGGGGLSALVAGCAVLLVAGLSPWTLMKIIPLAGDAAGRTLSRGHVSAAVMAMPGADAATLVARQLILKNFGQSSARSSPSAAPAPTMPSTRPQGDAPLPSLPPRLARDASGA
jgi:hypothetical protein